MKRSLIALLFVVFSLLIVLPVFAQDSVPTPSADGNFLVVTGGQLLAYIALAVLAGGGLLAIFDRVLGDKNVQDAVERAYESWNPETQETIKQLLTDAHEQTTRVLDFLDTVTDGQPNDTPPSASTGTGGSTA